MERCLYCDDTGDVHDQIGEWRGRCICPAGSAQTQNLDDTAVESLEAQAAAKTVDATSGARS